MYSLINKDFAKLEEAYNAILTRIEDLQHQIRECEITGEYDAIERIEQQLYQVETEARVVALRLPDVNVLPW